MNLLIVGNDKIGRLLLGRIKHRDNLKIILDSSTDWKRTLKLVFRGSLQIVWLLKMVWAELNRKDYPAESFLVIYRNADLLNIIHEYPIQNIYLFRVGLIINQKIFETGVKIFNVHCASLPEYKGIGSIARALADKAFDQEAILYHITERVDEGEILATYPYKLDRSMSYKQNEDVAYEAGIHLLLKELGEKILDI